MIVSVLYALHKHMTAASGEVLEEQEAWRIQSWSM
jgi:hypothetical protein